MSTLVISAFVNIPIGTLVQASITMPRRGKIRGISISSTVRGAALETYLASSVSLSGDTTGVVVPVSGAPWFSNSVLAALVGYSLPAVSGGNGVNLNQMFLLETEVAANQFVYFNNFCGGADGRAWALIYLS